MEVEYKGCIYQYKKFLDYNGKPDKDNSVILTRVKPVNSSNNVIHAPATLDGKKIIRYEGPLLPRKQQFELVVDEGVDYFYLDWYSCILTSLELSKSVTSFAMGISPEMRLSLNRIIVDKDNPIYDSRNNSNCLIETKTNKLLLIGINSEIPDGVNEIGRYVFNDRRDLTSLSIPSSLTIIGEGAFRDCYLPNNFILPPSIKVIGPSAFYGARGIKELDFPNVEIIENSAFSCSDLSKITFGDKLKRISDNAFRLCNNLTELTLPDSLEDIAPNAFASSNIKTIYCSEKVALLIAKSKASTKIKVVINNDKVTVGELLNRPDNVFDFDSCIKTRKNYFDNNININMIIEYHASFDSGMPQDDCYNYYDYMDTVFGTLQNMPIIDASSFNEEILTNSGDQETILHNLTETFENDRVYSDFITLASTNLFNYLKYDYDATNDIYYIKGVKNIRSIGYLAIGFGKEKIIINSNAFIKRNIVNLYLGPNVIAIMENAFPSLTNSIVSISEGVDYIGPNAFTASNGLFRYAGKDIPASWSRKWNQHNRTFYKVECDYAPLRLSPNRIEDKVKNYNKYVKVTWDNEIIQNDYDSLYQESLSSVEDVIKMINLDDSYTKNLPEAYKNNPQVILAAIKKDPANFQYASSEIKKDKEFILEVLQTTYSSRDSIIPYIDESLLNDFDFMKQVIEIKASAINLVGNDLKDNKDLWFIALKDKSIGLEDYSGPLLNDCEFAKEMQL